MTYWPNIVDSQLSPHQAEQLALATRGRIGILTGGPGTGKAQPLDAKVLTPYGWRFMGDLKVNDDVIGSNGQASRVVGVFPQGKKEIFRVTMSDGSQTECCSEHLWSTTTRNERRHNRQRKVRCLSEIAKTITRSDTGGPNHDIPMTKPVEFPRKNLPIAPYLLGVLLGDGCFRGGFPMLSAPDEFIVEAARHCLPHGIVLRKIKKNKYDYAIVKTVKTSTRNGGKANSITVALRDLDLWGKGSCEKHVPQDYLLAPSNDRLLLLQGLLDTDAYTDGHSLEYSTSSPKLKDAVVYLVRSFGGVVSVAERIPSYTHNGERRQGQLSYRLIVKLPPSVTPFTLPRKLDAYIPRTKYQPTRRIVSIESVGIKSAQCISVESDDGLYVTDDFIVTHNTFAAAQLVKACINEYGIAQIAVAGPTGKSAVRVTEVMRAYGIGLRAKTIHSLLKVESSEGGWSFAFNRSNRLPYKVIIVDEFSMCDTGIAASLFAARPRGCSILILGDCGQLAPVGHGAPLRDMIASGVVPYGELREIHRNQGGIVQACADIRDGKPFQCEGNLELVPARGWDGQRQAMLNTIDAKSKAFGVDPVWGVQVLCAVNKKGELSRRELNKLLQKHLNPNPAIQGSPFRMQDKVICLKNSWLPLVDTGPISKSQLTEEADSDEEPPVVNARNQVYVANGEMGRVVRVEPGYFHMLLSEPKRLVIVPRSKEPIKENSNDDPKGDEEGNVEEEVGKATGCDWDLAFAISTHKSQGSEFDVVLVMIDEGGAAKRVCDRSWIYTSLSRAKQCCVLIGKLAVARQFCTRNTIMQRKTFLAPLIQEGRKVL